MSQCAGQPLNWEVNGLALAGLAWGQPDKPPLLALHGWIDNAASFALLAPLLENYYVVALDLTGHGQSARRSADASYQIWDDLPEILGVVDLLGWDSFTLLGHSRGAIIATLFASALPQRVSQLVLLDGLSPEAVSEQEFPQQMAKALQQKTTLGQRQDRVLASVDEAVAARAKRGLSLVAAQLLAERSLQRCEQGFSWTTDARLYGASAVKLTDGQQRAVLAALTMPTLLMVAEDGLVKAPELLTRAQALVPNLILQTVAGGHHFHMEDNVADVARLIASFAQENAA